MDIEEEAQGRARDLLGAAHRTDLDQLARAGDVRHRNGSAVDEELAGLGERDAEGLHDMAERRRAVRDDAGASLAALMGDEEPQLRGYFEVDPGSVHPARMPSPGMPPREHYPRSICPIAARTDGSTR